MPELGGKVAVVTGAGRGQGRAHALALAREGASVVVAGIDSEPAGVDYTVCSPGDLEETVELVEREGGRAFPVVADAADLGQMEDVVRAAVSEFGQVDIMVANAGVVIYSPVHEMTRDQWDLCVDVNLSGVFNSLRAVAPLFVRQRGGRFIGISSAVGRQGAANNAAYVAAKWGVVGLVKSAAMDLGPYDVTCNAICPGMVATQMLRNEMTTRMFCPGDDSPTFSDMDAVIDRDYHQIPGGAIDPGEVSHAVVFLASDRARFITGSTVDVTAGWSAKYTA